MKGVRTMLAAVSGSIPVTAAWPARTGGSRASIVLCCLVFLGLLPGEALAQSAVESKARASADLVITAVQQGISTLPPTAGQSFSYQYNPSLETYERREGLGPTSILSPLTVGRGAATARLSANYFKLKDRFTTVRVEDDGEFMLLGLQVDTKVAVFNFGLTYGLLERLDLTLNVPTVFVDAEAAPLSGCKTPSSNDPCLRDPGQISSDEESEEFRRVIEPGKHVGLGRVSLGAKYLALSLEGFRIGGALDFFAPSPNERQLAGSDSPAIYPRIVSDYTFENVATLQAVIGYDYDFDREELRRFVWNFGAWTEIWKTTVDAGLGGAEFQRDVRVLGDVPTVGGGNNIDSSYVDLLFGVKHALTESVVVSGALNVPLIGEGLRPDVFGMIAVEYWLSTR